MILTDYLIIAAILISAVAGALRGFLRESVALGSWIVALFLAWHFSDLIEPHLGGLLADSDVRPWAARVIITVLVLLLGAALGALLGHFVRLSIFSGMDRLLGFAFGLAARLPAAGRVRDLRSAAAAAGGRLVAALAHDSLRRVGRQRPALARGRTPRGARTRTAQLGAN